MEAAECSVDTRPHILVVQTVLGHPDYMPTFAEIDYHVPDTDFDVLNRCIDELCEEGVIERHHTPSQQDVGPFYRPTVDGVEWADERGLLDGLPITRAAHQVLETPQHLRQYAEAERPPLPVGVDLTLPDVNASAWQSLLRDMVESENQQQATSTLSPADD